MSLSEAELQKFKQAVQNNCDISDTFGTGIFSICGMALRLRDLNKWEKGLKPWEDIESARQTGFRRSKQYAQNLVEIYTHAPDANDLKAIRDRINQELVEPLL